MLFRSSIYKNVYKLEPGCLLTLRPGQQPLVEKYWDLRDVAIQNTSKPWGFDEQETLNQLDHVLGEAVRQRLMADVPLGAFLSGGIDSSTVVALMQKYSDRPVQTFTIGFRSEEHTSELQSH